MYEKIIVMHLQFTNGPLQLIICINDTCASRSELQLDIQTKVISIQQIGKYGQLVKIAVVHDAEVLFCLTDRKLQGFYRLTAS